MINKKDLWNKNGDVNEQAIIPDILILPPLQIDYFDCDTNLEQYKETLFCDGDDPICIMSVKDDLGNHIDLDMRVRGEVRIGWRDNINDDFAYYKHYSQFPEELTKAIKEGNYYHNPHVDVADSNWISTVITDINSNDEEMYCDATEYGLDKFIRSTPAIDEIKSEMLEIAETMFDYEYQKGSFIKPDITLINLLSYVGNEYDSSKPGETISLAQFPQEGINTYLVKNLDKENEFDVYINNAKDNSSVALKKNCEYCCLYNYVMDIACGELECDNGKTIKENLDESKKGKNKQDFEKA